MTIKIEKTLMTGSTTKFELSIPVKQAGKRGAATFYGLWLAMGLYGSYVLFGLLNEYADKHLAIAGMLHLAQFVAAVIGGLIYVYIPYQIAVSRAHGQALIVNQDGIGLPQSFFGIGSSQWVMWNEVKSVNIGRSMSGKPTLLLAGGGKKHEIKLARIEKPDMEQLLLAIEAWAPTAVWSTAMQEYRDEVQSHNFGSEGFSQTQLFEDELSKRFSAPTFVPLEPGKSLRSGTIEVVRQLAFGGFAAVYLAEDSVNGTVVLKESVAPAMDNEQVREKASELFAREAMLLRSLDHPDIAKVFDFFVEDNRSYIVMEFIDGINLRQLVAQQGPQDEQRVLEWSEKVAGILKYLHEQRPPVVHRDVTPDNIVLTNLGEIKLIDFGASNQFIGKATGTLVGKHAYMPPEQIRGKTEPVSDIFALGATMHFLLTGKEPEPLSISKPSLLNAKVSATASDIVTLATQMDMDKRVPTAEAFLNRLRDAADPGSRTNFVSIVQTN